MSGSGQLTANAPANQIQTSLTSPDSVAASASDGPVGPLKERIKARAAAIALRGPSKLLAASVAATSSFRTCAAAGVSGIAARWQQAARYACFNAANR